MLGRATMQRRFGTALVLSLLMLGAGSSVLFTQSTPNCQRFNFSPATASFPAAGGNGSVVCDKGAVTNGIYTGCQWTAYTNASWITLVSGTESSNQAGIGMVSYRVAANTGPARSGTIIFATSQYDSASYTITQAAAAIGPQITSITPSTVTAGGPAFVLTIRGTGLMGRAGTMVVWNGYPTLSPSSVSDTQVIVTVPADYISSQGSASIAVQTQIPGIIGYVTFLSNSLTLTIAPPSPSTPSIGASPQQVSFQSTVGNPVVQHTSVNLSTSTGQSVSYGTSISQGNAPKSWLSAPSNGVAPGTLSLTVDPTGLGPGTYVGTVTVTPISSNPYPQLTTNTNGGSAQITATLKVTTALISSVALSPQLLRFTYLRGWGTPTAKPVTVSPVNANQVPFTTTVRTDDGTPWLRALADAPTALAHLSTWVETSPLLNRDAGIYTGKITATADSGLSDEAPVSVNVLDTPNQSITLAYTLGGPSLQVPSLPPLVPDNGAPTQFVADATSDTGWLTVTPTTGTMTSSGVAFQPVVDTSSMRQGVYKGYYAVTAAVNPATFYVVGITVTVNTAFQITTTTLPGGVANQAYPATPIATSGGQTPISWSYSGAWPTGLTFNNGIIAGTPTVPGSYTFTVTATDSSSPPNTARKDFTIRIDPPALTLPTIQLVANAGSFGPEIAPNTFIMVKGTGLANISGSKDWGDSPDIGTGKLPKSLFGVRVLVNGVEAYISYLSSVQINALVPMGDITGPVNVQVDNNGSLSAPARIQMQAVAPAFFLFSGKHIATTRGTGIIAPLDMYPGSSPARPGDIITFWGTGFGHTSPPAPDGMVLTQAYRNAETPRVFFGEIEAQVDWAGLAGSGLFQMNVKVPNGVPDGEIQVQATVGGQRTQSGVTVPVKR